MLKPDSSIIKVTIVALALGLVACQPASEPEPADERAKARWEHLIAGDYAKAWEYFTPGYRETAPVQQYVASIQRRPVQWQKAEVVSSSCEDVRCEVVVNVTYSLPRASAGLDTVKPTRPVRETWILSEGSWWYTPEN